MKQPVIVSESLGSLRLWKITIYGWSIERGHGDSERPACCYSIGDFAVDAVAFLDAVGVERAALIGHSGSAFTARRVAVTHPERVARLVLSGSPAGSLPEQVAAWLQAAVRALVDPVSADFVREFQAGAAYVPLPEALVEGLVAESRKLPARVWRAAADGVVAFVMPPTWMPSCEKADRPPGHEDAPDTPGRQLSDLLRLTT